MPPPPHSPASSQNPAAGDILAAKYRLEEEIGRGSAGIVFRAEDTFMHREVAIKVLPLDAALPEERLPERMRREVVISGRLDHPHIVRVHDAGADGSLMYLVMELVEGHTLRALLNQRERLPSSEAVQIITQIVEALGCAHVQGIVHRDLKPENVLIRSDGSVKVSDFGLGKLYSEILAGDAPRELRLTLTDAGSAIGTPAYMAPEQFLGLEVDHRADLFAATALLYEMLAGTPLAAEVSPLMMASSLHPGRPAVEMPAMPGEGRFSGLLLRGLAVRREDRFQSCDELLAELQGLNRPRWTRWLPSLRR